MNSSAVDGSHPEVLKVTPGEDQSRESALMAAVLPDDHQRVTAVSPLRRHDPHLCAAGEVPRARRLLALRALVSGARDIGDNSPSQKLGLIVSHGSRMPDQAVPIAGSTPVGASQNGTSACPAAARYRHICASLFIARRCHRARSRTDQDCRCRPSGQGWARCRGQSRGLKRRARGASLGRVG